MLGDLFRSHGLKRAIYIGDTRGDADAASEARLEFAHVRYGFGEVDPPALSFESFREMVEGFRSSLGRG
jgi:phosphoglycolate phosphatase